MKRITLPPTRRIDAQNHEQPIQLGKENERDPIGYVVFGSAFLAGVAACVISMQPSPCNGRMKIREGSRLQCESVTFAVKAVDERTGVVTIAQLAEGAEDSSKFTLSATGGSVTRGSIVLTPQPDKGIIEVSMVGRKTTQR